VRDGCRVCTVVQCAVLLRRGDANRNAGLGDSDPASANKARREKDLKRRR